MTRLSVLLLLVHLLLLTVTASSATADPFITDILPGHGAAGEKVTIRGGNFVFPNYTANRVHFDGIRATVTSGTATALRVKVPGGTRAGDVSVTIANANGGPAESPTSFGVLSSGQTSPSAGTIPGKGDRKELHTYLSGFKFSEDPDNTRTYYAPAGSVLYVDKGADADGKLRVHFPSCFLLWGNCGVKLKKNDEPAREGQQDYQGQYEVKKDVPYTVSAAALQDAAALTRGVDYGVLVLPFKFHFSDQSLTGEASLGGYAGYQISWPGIAITFPVISAGVGVVNITKEDGNVTTSSSSPSLTVAYGVIINLVKTGLFQIGLISGFDWAGKGSHYKYEGKPWLSVSFGTNFTK